METKPRIVGIKLDAIAAIMAVFALVAYASTREGWFAFATVCFLLAAWLIKGTDSAKVYFKDRRDMR